MKLESMTAKVRPRSGWEALALGFRMAHHHWRSLWGIWFAVTLIPVLLPLIFFPEYGFWIIVGFWWLKPLWERPLLHFTSRALFGEYPSIKDTLKSLPGYFFVQWFPTLTYRRLGFTRSMDAAVIQLEGLSGQRRSRRIQTLHMQASGAGSWLTLLLFFLHFVVYFNLVLMVIWFVPEHYLEWLLKQLGNKLALESDGIFTLVRELIWTDTVMAVQVSQVLIHYLVISFISPFYVTGGFALYINQRTILEAWDIELTFKQLRQRIDEKEKKRKKSALIASCCLALVLSVGIAPGDSLAEEPEVEKVSIEHEQAKQTIEEIIESEAFNKTVTKKRHFFDFDVEEDKEIADLSGFSGFGKSLAFIFEILLWCGAFGLIVWLIVKFSESKYLSSSFKRGKKKKAKPDVLFGLEINEESLPDSPADEAWTLWQQGECRAAMSLLYRATLFQLIESHHCEFEDGYTELECVRIVDSVVDKNVASFFSELTQSWRVFAYAHQPPGNSLMQSLCLRWNGMFLTPEPQEAS
ncbi:hypothetical protein [Pleionea sp. CnH1-48]|uniref:hypothetical protein n=1 Tax=Pleionea sp. CnH1-48 TaxID=2954494 RepID=UPI002097A8B3|nr:hypothetical protein [Pleionea sp. CnH1-48]MCO7224677.1 hypothetical protein [Pleionea sp. CnH1-48]